MKKLLFISMVIFAILLSSCTKPEKPANPETPEEPGETEVTLESIKLDPVSLEMNAGDSYQLEYQLIPADAKAEKLVWTSSDDNVAKVSDEGLVTAMTGGEATVTLSCGKISASCNVTVTVKPASLGDIYYSDGTYSSGLVEGKTPIGIVFWLGNPGSYDKTLAADFPECTNGLVVSLDEDNTFWQENSLDFFGLVGEWVEQNTEYISVTSPYYDEDAERLNSILGYNNTKAIEAFNSDPANASWPVNAVANAISYREKVAAPASSSGWYLPSAKELSLLCCGEYEGNIYDITEPHTDMRDFINEKLSAIEGAAQLGVNNFYWSSTELDKLNAYYVIFSDGLTYRERKDYNTILYSRYVLAF